MPPSPDASSAALVNRLHRSAFDYFRLHTHPETGLVADTSLPGSPSSIATTGFGLSSYPVAIERGWMSRAEAAAIVLKTLRFFEGCDTGSHPDATCHRGFYYHFLDMQTGRRAWQCELSTIDSTLLLAGALAARTPWAATAAIVRGGFVEFGLGGKRCRRETVELRRLFGLGSGLAYGLGLRLRLTAAVLVGLLTALLAALAVFATLTALAILAVAAVAAVAVPVAAIVALIIIAAVVVVSAIFLVVGEFRRRTFDYGLRPGAVRRGRRLGAIAGVVADIVELVAVFIEIVVEVVTILRDVLDRHLRLCGGNDAIVVFGVLEIVLRHHPVAGALRVTGECGVFFGDLLSRSADLHVRAVALVGAGQGIRPLAVVVVATAAIVVATAHAPVLLLWPH